MLSFTNFGWYIFSLYFFLRLCEYLCEQITIDEISNKYNLFISSYAYANIYEKANNGDCQCKASACPPSTSTACVNNQCPLQVYQIVTKCEHLATDVCTRISGCGKDCVPSDCTDPRPCKEIQYCGCEKRKVTAIWGCLENGECRYEYNVLP